MHNAFARAALIEVGAVDSYKASSPFFGLSVGGLPSPMTTMGAMPDIYPETGEIWTLKVTKVGLLNRKDDILEGGKKAINRKWKTWSIILTGSQLLLFRDPSWATALLRQSDSSDGQILLPQVPLFRPDELLSVKDAIAVYDKSYVKVCALNVARVPCLTGRISTSILSVWLFLMAANFSCVHQTRGKWMSGSRESITLVPSNQQGSACVPWACLARTWS